MDNFHIETAQNVSIQQNVAHVSTRILSFFVDLLVITAYFILIIFVFTSLNLNLSNSFSVLWVLMSTPVFFYSLLFETFMNGQTPGKYVTGIRVVKIDGSKPTFGSYLLRWVLRVIDITLATGSVALLTILLNGKGQRLGDLAAGTTVISERKRISIENTINVDIPDTYVPTFPQVTTLSDQDIQTIKELYTKALWQREHSVISKLSNKIIDLTGIKTNLLPIDFVKIVIDDYNYFTQNM